MNLAVPGLSDSVERGANMAVLTMDVFILCLHNLSELHKIAERLDLDVYLPNGRFWDPKDRFSRSTQTTSVEKSMLNDNNLSIERSLSAEKPHYENYVSECLPPTVENGASSSKTSSALSMVPFNMSGPSTSTFHPPAVPSSSNHSTGAQPVVRVDPKLEQDFHEFQSEVRHDFDSFFRSEYDNTWTTTHQSFLNLWTDKMQHRFVLTSEEFHFK